MVSLSDSLLELGEGFGMKDRSPERGGSSPEATSLASGRGDQGLGLQSSVILSPLLCSLPVRVPLGQAEVWPGAVCQAASRSASHVRD